MKLQTKGFLVNITFELQTPKKQLEAIRSFSSPGGMVKNAVIMGLSTLISWIVTWINIASLIFLDIVILTTLLLRLVKHIRRRLHE